MPLFIERNLIRADSDIMTLKAGLSGQPVFGSFIITQEPDSASDGFKLTESDREELHSLAAPGLFSITEKPGVIIVRYLGACSETAKKVFTHYWALIRKSINQRGACPPRIWYT